MLQPSEYFSSILFFYLFSYGFLLGDYSYSFKFGYYFFYLSSVLIFFLLSSFKAYKSKIIILSVYGWVNFFPFSVRTTVIRYLYSHNSPSVSFLPSSSTKYFSYFPSYSSALLLLNFIMLKISCDLYHWIWMNLLMRQLRRTPILWSSFISCRASIISRLQLAGVILIFSKYIDSANTFLPL